MTPAGFTKTLYVGWGDLDANGHMRNTAYLDKAADVRMYYFAEHCFPSREFARLAIGPVVRTLIAPPEGLRILLEPAPRSDDFRELPGLPSATGA